MKESIKKMSGPWRVTFSLVLLISLIGCAGPGEGRSEVPRWLVNTEARTTTAEGISFDLIGVGSQLGGRFDAYSRNNQTNLVVTYALYVASDTGNDEILFPAGVTVADDTKSVQLLGRVTHLTTIGGVSLGVINFDGGPAETSKLLTLSFSEIRKVTPDLEIEVFATGEWRLLSFLSLDYMPPKDIRLDGYMISGTTAVYSHQYKDITVEAAGSLTPALGKGTEDLTPVQYYLWSIRVGTSSTQQLFAWAELHNGDVVPVSLTDYLEASGK